jgi:hypothetical protein
MRKHLFLSFLALVALAAGGCGVKPAMEGGRNDEGSEVGSVSESSATGAGDTTSFSEDKVEKVDEYIVRAGDNLWNIAAKGAVYHSGWLYPLILKANRGKFKDPRNMKVGTALKIPRGLPQADYDVAREDAMAGTFESEVGPLKAMQDAAPQAAPPAAPKAAAVPAPKAKAPKRGKGWIVVLGALVLGGAAWQGMRMRKRPPQAG